MKICVNVKNTRIFITIKNEQNECKYAKNTDKMDIAGECTEVTWHTRAIDLISVTHCSIRRNWKIIPKFQ